MAKEVIMDPRMSFAELLGQLSREYNRLSQQIDTLKAENEKLLGLDRQNSMLSNQASGLLTGFSGPDVLSTFTSGGNLGSSADSSPPPPTMAQKKARSSPGGLLAFCHDGSATAPDSFTFGSVKQLHIEDDRPDQDGWLRFDPDAPEGNNGMASGRQGSFNLNWSIVGSQPLPRLPKGSGSGLMTSGSMINESMSSSMNDLLEVQDIWTTVDMSKKHTFSNKLMRSKTFANTMTLRASETVYRGGDAIEDENGIFQRCVMGPSSRTRLFWDAVSVLVLAIDILTVPLTVYSVSEDPAMQVIGFGCTIFWTTDIPMSLVSGFHTDKGLIEMRPYQIWRNYFRTWFFFDITVIGLDWVMIILDTGFADVIGIVRLGKVARVTRIFRLFRLLRMLKMPAVTEEISDSLHSESLYTTFGVLRSLAGIALINHFIACGWYGIGTWGTPGWVSEFEASSSDTSLAHTYTTSLHWSFAQFTPASMEIGPHNLSERVYAIIVLLGGLVVFSSFVSSITAAMTQLHQVNKQATRQAENVRKYIHDNKLSLDLGNRIVSFARRAKNSSRRRVHESEIEIFQVLPQSLKIQVHWEVYSPILHPHPLFYNFADVGDAVLLEICNTAMSEQSLSTSQELFTYGQGAVNMYFILSGELEYFHHSQDQCTCTFARGQQKSSWCSEASIWLKWEHQGRLVAMSHSEFAILSASTFRRIVSEFTDIFVVCKEYAIKFQEMVQGMPVDTPVDVWDIMTEDSDTLKEMAMDCFDKHFVPMPKLPRAAATAKSIWRPWHSVSLLRLKTPPVENLKRSRSLP